MTISEYLRARGLTLQPLTKDAEIDTVLNNEELLNGAVNAWNNYERAITAVVQSRVNSIAMELLTKASPEEVVVMRQSLVELGAILKDFQVYVAEANRRNSKKEIKEEAEPEISPPSEENVGSL